MGISVYFLIDNRMGTPIQIIFYDIYCLTDEVVGK